jgi:hypothetical protein
VGNHVGEESVAGNVEGDAQAHIARTLVQLAGQLTICHIKLGRKQKNKVIKLLGKKFNKNTLNFF